MESYNKWIGNVETQISKYDRVLIFIRQKSKEAFEAKDPTIFASTTEVQKELGCSTDAVRRILGKLLAEGLVKSKVGLRSRAHIKCYFTEDID